jgi:hypothetical protein
MSLPEGFYAEPRFRKSSPDFAKLRSASTLTLDTPGIGLALALDYYKVEVFARRVDRDRACGPTAHPDVQYFPIKRKALLEGGISSEEISCGYAFDHPKFATVLDPMFGRVTRRLLADATGKKKNAITAAIMTIARARYTISATWKGDWLNFSVDAYSAFDEADGIVMERTTSQLHDRLALNLSFRRSDHRMN